MYDRGLFFCGTTLSRELPTRKPIRLKGYDYSKSGAYFITTCVKNRYEMLSTIAVGAAFCRPQLSNIGIVVENEIITLSHTYTNVSIDKYVIMPNHVHMIILIHNENNAMVNNGGDGGASGKPRPTNALIPKHISSIKRFTNKQAGFDMWQDGYHDHIIRDETDYQTRWRYIDENPAKWAEDDYFVKKSEKIETKNNQSV